MLNQTFNNEISYIYNNNNPPLSSIYGVQFSVGGNEQNKIWSTVDVQDPEMSKNMIATTGGIIDPHMGSFSKDVVCHTCLNRKPACPGHFGSVYLKYPLKSPLFRSELLKWMKILCYHCSNIVLPIKPKHLPNKKRLNDLTKEVRSIKECVHCHRPHLQVYEDPESKIIFLRESDIDHSRREYYNNEIEEVVNKVTDETVLLLGIPIKNHPRKFIVRYMCVPPNTIRPDIKKIDGDRTSNSDTTTLLQLIVRSNIMLPDTFPSVDQITLDIQSICHNMDAFYAGMISGSNQGDLKVIAHTNRELVSLTERWAKKLGRVRRNLLGKRVVYMIRGVVTGNNKLKLDSIGIPKVHAKNMEILETVTSYNYERLNVYFMNKQDIYPGCQKITKKSDGGTYRTNILDPNYRLQIGDIVHRDLVTGDWVYVNRQPSLLYCSIIGMRAVVTESDTLEMNPSDCILINADFDGDAISAIIPQDICAAIECKYNAPVSRWVVSPQTQDATIGTLQDTTIGLAVLTRKGVVFDKWHAMALFSSVDSKDISYDFTTNHYNTNYVSQFDQHIEDKKKTRKRIMGGNTDKGDYYQEYLDYLSTITDDTPILTDNNNSITSGGGGGSNAKKDTKNLNNLTNDKGEIMFSNREIISRILPEINITKKPTIYKEEYAHIINYDPEDITVNIKTGKLISGVLDKATIGQKSMGGIVHLIANQYGNKQALAVAHNLQQIGYSFLSYNGFTTGLDDLLLPDETTSKIHEYINGMILESERISEKLCNGTLQPPIGISLKEYFEREQLAALSIDDNLTQLVFTGTNYMDNALCAMTGTGARGKINNVVSIHLCVGSQTMAGKRFDSQTGATRKLPYYPRYDLSPEANGFISASFKEGIPSNVFPFIASSDRDGQINLALVTSTAGYHSRMCIKHLESTIVDNFYRANKRGKLIQLLCYETGFDPAKTEKVKFPGVFLNNKDFGDKFYTDYKSAEKISSEKDIPIRFTNISNTKSIQEALDREFEQLLNDREEYRSIHITLENNNPGVYVMKDVKQMPVDVARIIDDTVYSSEELVANMKDSSRILDPIYAIDSVITLCEDIPFLFYNEIYKAKCKKDGRKPPVHIEASLCMFRILLRMCLSTSELIRKNVINKTLDIIVERIKFTFIRCLLDPGNAVGVLTAQCNSEPETQYVLDSKHRAGGQGGTTTNAIKRNGELSSAKVDIENPHTFIIVKEEYECDKNKVQDIANHIEMLRFDRFLSNTDIFFEEIGKPVHPLYQREKPSIIGQKIPNNLVKWCIRFGLNREEMIMKSIGIDTIVFEIRKKFPDLFIIHSPENDDNLYIRCYIKNKGIKLKIANYYESHLLPLMKNIRNAVVRGVPNIRSAEVTNVVRSVIDEDGNITTKTTYGIACLGINMDVVLTYPDVDPYRTQCDSVKEMERVYGIVCARNKIINELMITMDGLIRPHCSLVADEQTVFGQVLSIQRMGLQKKNNSDILLRIAFQTPIKNIVEASLNNTFDTTDGISGSLIVGNPIRVGTFYNGVVLNQDFIDKHSKSSAEILSDL